MRPASFVLCILLPLPVYAGPATKPAPHPTTHLATTRLSGENNPKRLLTIYALAMANGDADRVKDSFWAETPDQRAVVDAYAHLARSVGALRKASTDKYGPDGFDHIGFGQMFAERGEGAGREMAA